MAIPVRSQNGEVQFFSNGEWHSIGTAEGCALSYAEIHNAPELAALVEEAEKTCNNGRDNFKKGKCTPMEYADQCNFAWVIALHEGQKILQEREKQLKAK